MNISSLSLLLACGLLLADESALAAPISIMPIGDSITAGGGYGQSGPGYRGPLYNNLIANGVSFAYAGINTNSNGPTTGLPSLPAGYLNHNGYGSYTLADINSNLAANGTKHSTANNGGFWLTGGNPTTDISGGALNRPAVFPDVVLLMAGTNDADYSYGSGNGTVANGYGLTAMQNSMHSILTWFNTNRPNTTVIVGTVVPWNKYGDNATDYAATSAQVVAFNNWLRTTEIPSFPKYRLVDMNPLFLNSDGTNNTTLFTPSQDGIHPNSAGYTLVGDAWFTGLQALGVVPKWKGDGTTNDWSTGGTPQFEVFASGGTTSSVSFAQNTPVYFDDTGSNAPVIALTGALSPTSVTVNASQAYTFGGTGGLGGTMSLTKDGTGSLTLATNNTFSGAVLVKNGVLQVGAGATTGSLGTGGVTVNNGASVAFNRSDAVTIANVIAGAGGLQQTGGGTTTLTGANTYAGPTTVTAGTLQIGNGGTTGSLGESSVTNNASLVWNRSDNVTLFNVLSGSGSLTKLGAGTLTLAAAETYTGATVISGGTLKLQGKPALVTAGLLYQLSADTAAGYTMNANGVNVDTFKDLSGNARHFTSGGTTNGPTVLTGANGINGLNVLHFSGAGTSSKLVLGTSTTPRSIFIVNRPSAETFANNAWGQNGGFLNGIWGQSGADFGIRLATATTNAWQYGSGNVNDYVRNGSGSMWINGVAVASNAAGSFAATTPHILAAANSAAAWSSTGLGSYFTGSNRAYSGDIAEVLAYNTVLGTFDRQAVEAYLSFKWLGIGGPFTVLSSATPVNLSQSGAALDLNGNQQTLASLTGVAGSNVYLGGATLTVGDGTDTTFAGAISGAGGLTKTGAGTLTLSGANTYTGTTRISNGQLTLSGSITNSGTIEVVSGGTLKLDGGTITATTVHIYSGGLLTGSGTINATVINDNGGTLGSNGSSPLSFTGTVVNSGLVQLTGGARLTASGSFTNNGTLDLITGDQTLPAGFVNNGVIITPGDVKVSSMDASGGNFSLTLQSYSGHNYQLQRTTSLAPASWQNINSPVAGTGSVLTLSHSGGVSGQQVFYRVLVSP